MRDFSRGSVGVEEMDYGFDEAAGILFTLWPDCRPVHTHTHTHTHLRDSLPMLSLRPPRDGVCGSSDHLLM